MGKYITICNIMLNIKESELNMFDKNVMKKRGDQESMAHMS